MPTLATHRYSHAILGVSLLLGCGAVSEGLELRDEPRKKPARTLPHPPTGGWVSLDDKPAPRTWHTAVVDEARGRMVVFGGQLADGGTANDIWDLKISGENRGTWSRISVRAPGATSELDSEPVLAPSLRYLHTAVYDPVGQRMIVFGGRTFGPAGQVAALGEVWALSLKDTFQWTRLEVAGDPPPVRLDGYNAYFEGVYDSNEQRLLLIGDPSNFPEAANVFALSLTDTPAWSRIAPVTRVKGSAGPVYDPVRRRLLYFSRENEQAFRCEITNVWALSLDDALTWTELDVEGPGPNACETELVVDAPRDRLIGVQGGGILWTLSMGATPMRWEPNTGHGHGFGTSVVLDARSGFIVLFGGREPHGKVSNATRWLHVDGDVVRFDRLDPSDAWPPPGGGMGFDRDRERWLSFGGQEGEIGGNPGRNLYQASLVDPRWALIPTAGQAPSLESHSQVYDATRKRLLLFGGNGPNPHSSSIEVNDVYALEDSWVPPRWSKIAPAGVAPAPRLEHTAIYDEAGEQMIVFGGRSRYDTEFNPPGPDWTPARAWNDLWTLSWKDGAALWREVHAENSSPSPRFSHGAAWDSEKRRMFIIGGATSIAKDVAIPVDYLTDVWELSVPDLLWRRIETSGQPPGAGPLHPVYDATSDRLLVFEESGDVRALSLRELAEDGTESGIWRPLCSRTIGPGHVRAASLSQGGVSLFGTGSWWFDPEDTACLD